MSMRDKLVEIGEAAEGRGKQGKEYPLSAVLLLLMLGNMCGYHSYQKIRNFFDPYGAFCEEEKKRKTIKKDVKEANLKKMSKRQRNYWRKDLENAKEKMKKKSKENLKELQKLYPFKDIPSVSVFSRAIQSADTLEIVIGLYELFSMMIPEEKHRHLAIDGKALRAALNKATEGHSLYLLNVYDVAARIFLTSFRVGDKKNEASTLKEELRNILLGKPSIVTLDAAGTQQELIRLIASLGSVYILPVKGNQKTLARLIYNYILEQRYDRTEDIYSTLDLGGYDEYDQPSKIIVPTVVKVAEEANENADEYATLQEIARDEAVSEGLGINGEHQHTSDESPDEGSTVIPSMFDTMEAAELKLENGIPVMVVKPSNDVSQVLPLFHDQFYYPIGIKPELNPQTKELVYAEIGNMYLPMVANGERYERREYILIHNPSILKERIFIERFESATTIMLATRYRLECHYSKENGKHWELSVNSVPYTANDLLTVEHAASLVKNHWRVEQFHNCLDTKYKEDGCTARTGDAPWALSTIRKGALNMISYIGGKRATVSDNLNHTSAMYLVRDELHDNISNGIKYLMMDLETACDAI